MVITNVSILTFTVNTLDIPMTEEQYNRYIVRHNTGEKVQHIFPELSPEIREFLINGITPEEWKNTFGEMEEEELLSTGYDNEKNIDENPRQYGRNKKSQNTKIQ